MDEWPRSTRPVPPPGRCTFRSPALRHARSIIRPSIQAPLPWPSCSGASSQPADIDQNAGSQQRDDLAGSTVRHERQREAGRRDQAQGNGHVHERRQTDRGRESNSEVLAERIRRGPGDTEAEPAEESKQRDDYQDPDEAPLLSNSAEEKIGVRVGEVAELLLSFAEADSKHLARSDSYQRLMDLKACLGCGISRIQKGEQPGQPVLDIPNLMENQNHRDTGNQPEVPDLGSGSEQNQTAQQRDKGGHREVRLQEDQHRYHSQNY